MDFKSLLSKIESIDGKVETPKAPQLPKTVQLDESASLRVLAGQSSYIAEAKKKKDEKMDEVFDADAKPGDTKKTAKGVATKTKTGLVHKSTSAYGGSEEEKEDDKDAPASKGGKKAKKESIDVEAFSAKFSKMVEGKKGSKPDFADLDKDGDKKEPMKKAAKEAKGKKVEEGKDEGKPGKNFAKIAKKAGEKYGSKAAGERVAGAVKKKVLAKESRVVAESVEQRLSFKDMVRLVQESGGQQQIDAKDEALFAWANRVAVSKLGEGMKAELYAGLIYERNGGVFEMYDVLSENQN